jgi:hypothetical protein
MVEVTDAILQYFETDDLPAEVPAALRAIAMQYETIADFVSCLPKGPERSVALRKLLESKDAAIRAAL